MRNAYKLLGEKSEWRGPFVRPMRRWEDNIKVKLKTYFVRLWIVFIWLRMKTTGALEHDNKLSGFLAS